MGNSQQFKLMSTLFFIIAACLLLLNRPAFGYGAFGFENVEDNDLELDKGNIFSDFNEDLESSEILEDERFYRYGRFYAINATLGYTTFTSERGSVYANNPPTFGFSLTYFLNFQTSFVLGFASSKHDFVLEVPTRTSGPSAVFGLIEVRMFRVFTGVRYYVDTTNLGTAITYSNPYVIGRFEYWYHTNKFVDREDLEQQNFGAFGTSVGMGLEFPIELKKSYVGVELLYHAVGFEDKFTTEFRAIDGSEGGVNSLDGDVVTLTMSYIVSF